MASTAKKNIDIIIKSDLCMGCGACAAVCPQEAIKINYPVSYRPALIVSKCNMCGLCYEVCPGKGWPAVRWATAMCKNNAVKMSSRYGPAQKFFLGSSQDPNIRNDGASGGVATSLLLYLLKIKAVDAVAVVGMEKGYPVSKITAAEAEVLVSSGSKYSPVPTMENVLKKLKTDNISMAITAIPCHLAALHYAIERDKSIIGNVKYTIGLFCGDLKNYASVYRIAESLGFKYPEDAKFLGWRCGTWPGNARFQLNDGSIKEKPLRSWLSISIPYYSLRRCLMCPARENWLSDVSLADNHIGGTSETVIVARTKEGHDMLVDAVSKGFINLNELDEGQVNNLVTRTKFVPGLAYLEWRKLRRYYVPFYDYDRKSIFSEYSRFFIITRLLKYLMFDLVRSKIIFNFIRTHPALMEKTGRILNNFPHSVKAIKHASKIIIFFRAFFRIFHMHK